MGQLQERRKFILEVEMLWGECNFWSDGATESLTARLIDVEKVDDHSAFCRYILTVMRRYGDGLSAPVESDDYGDNIRYEQVIGKRYEHAGLSPEAYFWQRMDGLTHFEIVQIATNNIDPALLDSLSEGA